MQALTDDQVVQRWPIIKAAIKMSAAPMADTNEDKLNNILRSILEGAATVWMTGNSRKPRTVVIASVTVEGISLTRNLLIYCAHGFEKETSEQYVAILSSLVHYARGQRCDNIISYVWNDKIIEKLKAAGAECNYTLVVYPLN